MINIKFRVFDIDYKVFRYFDLADSYLFWISQNTPDFKNKTSQFTGLTDKNNKEIFDGDIVKISDKKLDSLYLYDEPVEVIWDYFSFGLKCKDKVGNREFVGLSNFKELDLEVIGNIFEK